MDQDGYLLIKTQDVSGFRFGLGCSGATSPERGTLSADRCRENFRKKKEVHTSISCKKGSNTRFHATSCSCAWQYRSRPKTAVCQREVASSDPRGTLVVLSACTGGQQSEGRTLHFLKSKYGSKSPPVQHQVVPVWRGTAKTVRQDGATSAESGVLLDR